MRQRGIITLAVAIALAAGFAGAVGAWRVQAWRYAAIERDRLEAQREKERNDRRAVDTAAVAFETDRVRIRTKYVTVTQTVERIIREPFYAAPDAPLCFDDSGMRALRDAIGAAVPAGEPALAVPRPPATR